MKSVTRWPAVALKKVAAEPDANTPGNEIFVEALRALRAHGGERQLTCADL